MRVRERERGKERALGTHTERGGEERRIEDAVGREGGGTIVCSRVRVSSSTWRRDRQRVARGK